MSTQSRSGGDLWPFSKLEQPTMSLQTQHFFTRNHSRFDSRHEPLWCKKKSQDCRRRVAAAFDMEVEVELKQGGYLPVENNPALARELMDFF